MQLFAKRGLAATKITDIATASHISQGLLYHYYKSKEVIFVELLKEAYNKMITAALGLERLPLSPLEKIKLAIAQLLQGFNDNLNTAYYYLLINQASIFEAVPDEAKVIVEGSTLLHDVIARIIADGQKEGTFKPFDPQEMSMVFWTSLNGLAISKAVQGEKFKAPDANILLSIFIQDDPSKD